MFINETCITISFIATIIFSAAISGGTKLEDLGLATLFFVLCMSIVNKLLKKIGRSENEADKLNAIYNATIKSEVKWFMDLSEEKQKEIKEKNK